ncbi:hypothetical protein EW093_05345 [Thiospirochaeta perfilievii]|uniref:CXXX repeat peptide modification system protein n=1 Tax=Thiospirochaeta perfilievii TaxID=252967 RepID=A0A5C1QAS2_9SPIO|nr:hypothetical protein [Thiospirochaeta perfilievii]QEN04150.1 hypothetical protein EW093_05345 [Thiospirochaeta perfilievii]
MKHELLCILDRSYLEKFQELANKKGCLLTLLTSLKLDTKEMFEEYVANLIDVELCHKSWWKDVERKYGFSLAENTEWRIDYSTRKLTKRII